MATIHSMVVVSQNSASADTQNDLIAESGANLLAGLKLKSWIKTFTSGMQPAVVQTKVNAAKATGTITLNGFVADDTVTINGIGFTGKGTPAAATEFTIGGTDILTAVSAIGTFNGHTTLDGMIIASSSLSVMTVTALIPGEIGNAVTIAISAHGSVSAARLASGTNGDVERTHYYGSGA